MFLELFSLSVAPSCPVPPSPSLSLAVTPCAYVCMYLCMRALVLFRNIHLDTRVWEIVSISENRPAGESFRKLGERLGENFGEKPLHASPRAPRRELR